MDIDGTSPALAGRMRELRYAIRQLVRAPGYAAVAALTLTLGMGATIAFYSVLDGVVLRQPYPGAERLLTLENRRLDAPANGGRLARAEVVDYRERLRAIDQIAAWDLGRQTLTAAGGSDGFAERVKVSGVTPNLFPILGVAPARGRGFRDEDATGARPAIISDALWRARFAAAPDVLSRTIRLNGVEVPILGVMPAGFSYPETEMSVWLAMPLAPVDASDRTDHYLGTVARLAPGADLAAAQQDLTRVAAELRRERPDVYPDPQWTIGATSLRDHHYGALRLPLAALLAASGSVLLIACVNVAIMSLLRAIARRRELAIRLAIGAGRGSIVRQLLTEAAVVSTIGAIGGVLLAQAAIAALVAFAPADVPRLNEIGLNLPAVLFTGAILIVVTLIVGLAPALVAANLRAFEGVVPSGRASDTRSTVRLRDALTILEVGLAAALVICAGLTLRSLDGLLRTDLGYQTANRVSFKTNLTAKAYPDLGRVEQFYDQLTTRLAATTGVRRLGAISYLPLSGEGPSLPGSAGVASESTSAQMDWRIVRGDYFGTMGIALLHGRLFADTDRQGAPPVALVDDVLARRWWPHPAAAVGQTIRIGRGPQAELRTIVGVVRHVSHTGPGHATLPAAFAPHAQAAMVQRGMYTVVETTAPPAEAFAAARAALAAVDPTVPLYFAETSARRVDDVVALPRFVTGLVSAFSAVALLLAGVGIFGVTGYAVSQRTREFGIRLALGAQRAGIGGLVLRRVAVLVGLGLAVGSALALSLGPSIAGLLHDVQPDDPSAFVFAVTALGLTALLATLIPVRAAVRVNPAVTLKAD
jgi:putative ABC transport system permease protein